MSLSPWLAVFWAALVLTLAAALHTGNRNLITAAILLGGHQTLALGASLMVQSKTIYEIYGLLAFTFWALCGYVWRSQSPNWAMWFTGGFLILLFINAVAFWTRTETTLAVWPMTLTLYAMMAIIINRWWHERGRQGVLGLMVLARASVRHQLVKESVPLDRARK